jgi:hypothetical protein
MEQKKNTNQFLEYKYLKWIKYQELVLFEIKLFIAIISENFGICLKITLLIMLSFIIISYTLVYADDWVGNIYTRPQHTKSTRQPTVDSQQNSFLGRKYRVPDITRKLFAYTYVY